MSCQFDEFVQSVQCDSEIVHCASFSSLANLAQVHPVFRVAADSQNFSKVLENFFVHFSTTRKVFENQTVLKIFEFDGKWS